VSADPEIGGDQRHPLPRPIAATPARSAPVVIVRARVCGSPPASCSPVTRSSTSAGTPRWVA